MGHQVHVALGGEHSDRETVREKAQGLYDMSLRYPGAPIDMVVAGDCDPSDYAESLVDTGVLVFASSTLAVGTRSAYLARLARDVEGSHRLPGGTATPMGTAVHEYGHFVELGLAVSGWKQADTMPEFPYTLQEGVGRVIAQGRGGERPRTSDVAKELGGYATKAGLGHAISSTDGRIRKELLELTPEAVGDVHMNARHARRANKHIVFRLDKAVIQPGPRIAEHHAWELARAHLLSTRPTSPEISTPVAAGRITAAAGFTPLTGRQFESFRDRTGHDRADRGVGPASRRPVPQREP
ncbi:hypothetical protein OG948_55595 (plasmid) [Embleya sp. NBC_00888]|uniref:hypothetical protein n=1 Tax=Embleya sp. NBC_00888 TaxID=2975960 RepID=UPI00386E8D15|nr:hypothetical protein OG948_55595 [Embleya sp. NBC_00888]